MRERLETMLVTIEPLGDAVAFAAGLAFREYRHRASQGHAILSDFLIGGHALSLGATLLTRDARIYRAHFPKLPLITPENDNG